MATVQDPDVNVSVHSEIESVLVFGGLVSIEIEMFFPKPVARD